MGADATPGTAGAASKDPIAEIISMQERLTEVLRVSFHMQDAFRVAFKNSFEFVLNSSAIPASASGGKTNTSCSSKVSELLAKYFDKKLRSGGHSGGAEGSTMGMQLEQSLDKALALFCYVNSKDVFEAFYRKYLSRRLLLGKSASEELERSVISKLKAECGANYTSKLEGMFTDMELSKDIMVQYGVHNGVSVGGAAKVAGTKMDAHIQVLTTGFWPTPQLQFTTEPASLPAIFPTDIQRVQKHFESFYHSKYQGRRLSWAYSLDRCLVVARFPRGKKELEVSFHQSLVLCCFNVEKMQGRVALSYSDIKQMVPLGDSELQRTIISLCNGPIGTRVLVKEPKGRDLNVDTDVLRFNAEFVNKLFHIKINAIQVGSRAALRCVVLCCAVLCCFSHSVSVSGFRLILHFNALMQLRESIEETDKVNEEVLRDRQYQTDAVIVRIMKARKRLGHNGLISELLSQLKYPAKTVELKKRLESLIERDYLKRDSDDSTVYCYLA